MFANLLQLISRRPPPDYEQSFVQEVRIKQRSPRNPRIERAIVLGWEFIVLKSVFVIWAVQKYHLPFNPAWVIAPTVIFALLCTGVYIWRD
ncbi:MAG: hypothetical protein ABI222_09600 [Opitutaceae bacterium]